MRRQDDNGRRELAHGRTVGGLDAQSDRTYEHEARRAECEWARRGNSEG